MKLVLISFFVMFSSFVFAQKSSLKGFVSEQNTSNKIQGALVKTLGTNQIESNNSGNFILTFQSFSPGRNIHVEVVKDGWELVNEKEMSTMMKKN